MPFCWPAAEAAGGRPWTVMLASSYTYPCLYLRVCVRVCYYSWYIDVLCTNYFASAKLLASFPNCRSGFPLAPPALNPSAVALSFPGWYEIMIHVIAWCLNCYLINLITYCTYCLAHTNAHTHRHTHSQTLIVHMWYLCLLLISCGFLSSYEHCADYSHSVYVHNIFVRGHKFIYVVIHTYILHIIRLETAAFPTLFTQLKCHIRYLSSHRMPSINMANAEKNWTDKL